MGLFDGAFGFLGEYAQSVPFLSYFTGPLARAEQTEKIFEQIQNAQQDYDKIKGPEFRDIKYETDKLNPYSYERPRDIDFQTVSENPQLRSAQLDALRKIYDQGEGYGAAQGDALRRRALTDANQLAQAREGAALANAQARGVGGSGLSLALAQQNSQNAANRALSGGLDAAQQAALQRLQASQAYAQGLGQIRNQDVDLSQRNADIVNRFNTLNTQARNAVRQGNVDIQNRAQQYNVGNTNQSRQFNINRGDRNAQAVSDFALQKQNAKYQTVRDLVGAMQKKAGQDIETSSKDKAELYKIISKIAGSVGGGEGGEGGEGGFGGLF